MKRLLLVINQDSEPHWVAGVVSARQFEFVKVISSHGLFQEEQKLWARHLGVPVEFSSFGELLNDSDGTACDDFAEAGAARLLGQDAYNAEYQKLAVEAKNQLISTRILESRSFSAIYFEQGLGIEPKIWVGHGGKQIPVSPSVRIGLLLWRLKRKMRKGGTSPLFRLVYEGRRYFFFGSHARIPISAGIRAQIELIGDRLEDIAETMTSPANACHPALLVGLHHYSARLHEARLPVEVIADGYHPINYPRSYLAAFGPCSVVARDRYDADWFGRHGLKVLSPLPFMASAKMSDEFRCLRPRPLVLLTLNHAGDWTALINRDDTDILVMAFCNLAGKFSELEFVVRGHPTMADPSHEGLGSYARLKRFVLSLELPNLSWSTLSSDQDLARADLVVSEYSNMLLEAWRAGICGIAVNLTRRRSFMATFASLGFPHVSNANDLCVELQSFLSAPQLFRDRLTIAARRYNTEVVLQPGEAMRLNHLGLVSARFETRLPAGS